MCKDGEQCIVLDIIKRQSFGTRSDGEQKRIMETQRPMPPLKDAVQVLKDGRFRYFQPKYYIEQPWLCGCGLERKLFCWWCILFSTSRVGPFVSHGFNNFHNYKLMTTRHNKLPSHVAAADSFAKYFTQQRIDLQLIASRRLAIEAHNSEVSENRALLHILIDVVCLIGKLELPFRGHDEGLESLNKGNYREILKFLGKYNTGMQLHLLKVDEAQKANRRVFSGMSPTIQNDLIESVGNVMLMEIRKEFTEAQFVAVMLDETTDNDNISQLSTTLRYTNDEGCVIERFIEFTNVSTNRTAAALYKILDNFIQDWGFADKFIGQGYDGAAVMSGDVGGLQALVKKKYTMAMYLHCVCHIFNLCLKDVLKFIKKCRIFFTSLDGFASFFQNSPARTSALDEIVQKRFPRMIHIRWSYTGNLVSTVHDHRTGLLELYEYIIDNPDKFTDDTCLKARGLKSYLHDFDFIFQLVMHGRLFRHTDMLFKIFQQAGVSVLEVQKTIDSTLLFLNEQLTMFDEVYAEAETLISENVEPPRAQRRRENKEDYETLYLNVVNIIIRQVQERFAAVKSISFVDLLNPVCYTDYKSKFPSSKLDDLEKCYPRIFDLSRLKTQLTFIYSNPEYAKMSLQQVFTHLSDPVRRSAFSEVRKLCALILTLPSTTVRVECTFSALDRIKDYSRTSMLNKRLNGLSLMGIEKRLLVRLQNRHNFDDMVIREYLSKPRMLELTYK